MSVYKLTGTLGLDDDEYRRKLNEDEKFSHNVAGKIGGGLAKAAKAAGVALAAAGTAVAAIAKKSVEGYAEQEQLIGGVQKLYGNMGMSLSEYAKSVGKSTSSVKGEWSKLEKAQNLVVENARKAYKTAGMDANTYMETATSFSAALINSLGGDTVKAAKQTDVAMRAISDNYNTFGGDMNMISYAFQGFAKQNYTMLDNLKLGYGGTKQEMERLISDANEWGKANGKASNLSINSFSDVVTAIQQIQEKQKIAGTTAREAATTIEGSFGMLKSAWSNLLTGFSDKNADLGGLINNVVSSASTAFKNVMPVVEQSLKGIGTFVGEIAPIIADKLPAMISGVLPPLIKATGTLLTGLASALPQLFGVIVNQIPMLFDTVANAVVNAGPSIMSGLSKMGETIINGINTFATKVVPKIADGIRTGLPELISQGLDMLLSFSNGLLENSGSLIDAGISMIMAIVDGLVDSIPKIIETAPTIISNFANIINENAPKLLLAGAQIIIKLGVGIVKAIPTLVANIPKILKAIFDVWMAFNWVSLGAKAISAIGNGIKSLATAIPNAIKKIAEAAKTKITSINWAAAGKQVITFIKNGIAALATAIPNVIKAIASRGVKAVTAVNWLAAGKAVINFIKNGVVSLATAIPNALKAIGSKAISAMKGINWLGVGKNIVQGVTKGVKSLGSSFITSVVSMAKGAFKAIKDFFGIHSPSRLMEKQIGENVVAGLIKGIDNKKENAKKSAAELGQLYVEAVKNHLDDLKKLDKLSEVREVEYWAAVLKHTKKGTSAHKEAYANLYEARKNLYNNLKELNKNYKEDIKEIVSNLENSIKEVENKYDEAVRTRENAIKSFFGLFDKAKLDEGLDSQGIIDNLKGQVDALTDWDNTLDQLHERLGDTDLFADLQNMGIASLNTLKAVNNMSDEELTIFIGLYEKKNQIAHERSLQENEQLRIESKRQIELLQEEATKQIKSVEKQYKKDIKALGINANNAFNEAGKYSIKGMQMGMSDQFDVLETSMVARAREIVAKINAELASVSGFSDGSSATSYSSSSSSSSVSAGNVTSAAIKSAISNGTTTSFMRRGDSSASVLSDLSKAINNLPGDIQTSMVNAMSSTSLSINNREFARIVKAV